MNWTGVGCPFDIRRRVCWRTNVMGGRTTPSLISKTEMLHRLCPLPNDLFRHIPFPCHASSFRQLEILTPDLTWFKGGRSPHKKPITIPPASPSRFVNHMNNDEGY